MQIRDLVPWGRKAPQPKQHTEGDEPIAGLRREMNRVFDRFWNHFEGTSRRFDGFAGEFPRMEVGETDSAVEIAFEVPGLDEKQVEVAVAGDVLTVKGERKVDREERRMGWHLSERSYGAFWRTLPLPPGVDPDNAKAELRNGVLTVTLPKTPAAQAQVRRIAVKAA